jgi:anti-anti-sigma regulatory factor
MRYPPRSFPLADALLPWVEDDDMPDPPTSPGRSLADGVLQTALPTRLTTSNRGEFRTKIVTLVEFGERHFDIDCASTLEIHPAAWGMLLRLRRYVEASGGTFVLRGVSPSLTANLSAVSRSAAFAPLLSAQPPEVRS